MESSSNFKYLVSSKKDLLWGVIVDNVGNANILPQYECYPPLVGHPESYYFNPDDGRILDNYQIVYISRGQGSCVFQNGEKLMLSMGTLLIIPPYTWHSYSPDKETGWHEYWIGLRGLDVDNWFHNGCLDMVKRVLDIGISEEIIDCYDRAQKIALEEKVGYQQVLAGLANTILSLALYHNINVGLENDKNTHLMQEACKIVRENYLTGITSQEVAKLIKMGYPSFRKMFKEYTNISPAHYLMELKLQTARVLLMNSNRSVKDIASYLHYKDSLYFSALFRKYMGVSPFAYRKMCNNLRNDFDISI